MTGRPLLAAISGVLALALCVPAAVADPDGDNDTPTKAEVDAAKDAAHEAERNVAAVRADLVLANQRLQDASIEAGKAAEAYNAARWKLRQAEKAAAAADRRQQKAAEGLKAQEASYNQMLAATYEMSPDLAAMSKLVEQDGTTEMIDSANTVYNMNTSMDDITARYKAARTVADLTSDRADKAHAHAEDLATAAETAKTNAQRQEQAALSEANSVAAQKDDLISELADLQNISKSLATKRQAHLEQAAQERAARAAQAADEESSSDPAQDESQPTGNDPEPTESPSQDPGDESSDEPSPDPQPSPDPEPEPDPEPDPQTPPPPSSSAAQRAISFARAQIGEPYRWAAAGPSAWDCSGLTMKAWAAGGKYLPHYSVGQYGASTPIRSSQLKPGDLVFWGSSSSPSSIYHVALYVGNGQMIHAPRTGRNVTQESMYYWIPPNFFARP